MVVSLPEHEGDNRVGDDPRQQQEPAAGVILRDHVGRIPPALLVTVTSSATIPADTDIYATTVPCHHELPNILHKTDQLWVLRGASMRVFWLIETFLVLLSLNFIDARTQSAVAIVSLLWTGWSVKASAAADVWLGCATL